MKTICGSQFSLLPFKDERIKKMKKFRSLLFCAMIILPSCKKDVIVKEGIFTQVGTIQGPAESISSIAVSPNGQMIAYGTFADNLIRIINVSTMAQIRSLSGHTKPVTALAFSPNSQLLASTGTVSLPPEIDGTVRLWDVVQGTQIASVETAPAGTGKLSFSPDGSMLAGAGGGGSTLTVCLWNTTNLSLVRTLSGVFRMVAFSPDGSRIATGKRDDKEYILETATGNEITSFSGHSGWIQSVAYSSDGQTLATGGEDLTILVRNAQNGQTNLTLTGHTSYPDFLEFSPDESMLASLGSGTVITRTPSGGISIGISDADKSLRIWDLNTGVEKPSLNIESDILSGASFSSDWKILVTGSEVGLIRIFEWTSVSLCTCR
jgi:WD40 repeat protein